MTTENITLNIETGPIDRVLPVKNKHEVDVQFQKLVQVILSEIDCAIFYTNLHELFCHFIS